MGQLSASGSSRRRQMRDQSFPSDRAAGADAQQRGDRLDQSVAERQTAIAGHDDFEQVARSAAAGPAQPDIKHPSSGQPAKRRGDQALPPVQRFGNFHQITLMPERDSFERVGAEMKNEVDQTADDADSTGEQ